MMKVKMLDAEGFLERLDNQKIDYLGSGLAVLVRPTDLEELERRYNGQKETIGKYQEFVTEIEKAIDSGIVSLANFRDKAYTLDFD